jgi:Replication-relaxation
MTARYLTAARLGDLEARLAERDFAIMESVSELRFVSGAQLARLHFVEANDPTANARAARRALLRLVGLECLARLPRRVGGVRAGSAGFIYCLGVAGQRLSQERGWQPKRRGRRSQTPGRLFVDHALMVAELHTRLTEADRQRRLELLELVAEPACHRSYAGLGNRSCSLKPDSFVRIGAGDFEDCWFVEVDRGTEGSRALLGKLRQYLNYRAGGREQAARGVFPKVLWLVPNVARAEAIEGCIACLPRADRTLFGVAGFNEAVDVLICPSTATHT